MAIFKVEGGRRLRGEITPQGAKNEALQILCATLLTQEKVIVHNVPQILDVIQLIELLQAMGVKWSACPKRAIRSELPTSTRTTYARTTTAAGPAASGVR